jgi:outer membrane receptor protein involved in Fe transport
VSYSHTVASGLGIDARASYDAIRYYGSWQYRGSDGSLQPGDDTNDSDWLGGEVRVRFPEVARNKFFAGVEGQYRARLSLSSVNPDPDPLLSTGFARSGDERIFSVYAGDDIRLNRRVHFSLAARFDDYPDTFGAVINPRLAVLLQPYDDGHTKILFGSAFRAPSYYERYFNDGGVSQIAAGALAPERITTSEVEHTHQLSDEVSLTGAVYWSIMTNLVVPVTVSDGVIQFQNKLGTVHSAGVEAEARWRPGRGALFSLWYAFNRMASEIAYGSPRHTVIDDRNPDQRIGETLQWNFGLSGEYARWRVRYGAHIFNVLDQRPSLPAGPEISFPGHAVPQYGRTLRLSVGASF